MGRKLNELKPHFCAAVFELLARLTEAGIPVLIVCTGRTQAEQDAAFAAGTSKVRHSRHQDGLAIDLVLYEAWQRQASGKTLAKVDWDPFLRTSAGHVARDAQGGRLLQPDWRQLVEIVTALGLRSGATFGETYPGAWDGWDTGHAELPA